MAVATLVIPTTPAFATTSQAKQIKKLQHDVKILSARIKQGDANFAGFYSCLHVYDLTWYGDTQGTSTDGYDYTAVDGTTFKTAAMAPTDAGDTPSGSFVVFDCDAARVARSFHKSDLFSPAPIGSPTQARPIR